MTLDLAEQRAEVTRDAIRRGVVELLEHEHPAAVSIPEVARRAGVSVRTIYRYFPTKQALLDDVANIQLRRVQQMSTDSDDLYRDPERWLPALWRTFAQDLPAVRAQQASNAGADLRDRRLAQSREAVAKQLAQVHSELGEHDLAKLVDLVIAVTSSRMFLELHDRMGWDVDDAAELSLWAVHAMRGHVGAEALP